MLKMTKLLSILLIFSLQIIYSSEANGQIKKISESDLPEPHDFSYMDKWVEFELGDTIDIVMLEHFRPEIYCGVVAVASITYGITTNQDTIRIKDLCNMKVYHKGDRIKVAPTSKPTFSVTTPMTFDLETRKHTPSELDLTVLKTTWGTLVN